MREWLVSGVAAALELLAVAVLVAGVVLAFGRAAARWYRNEAAGFTTLRQSVGRAILLTLELLVGADILRTLIEELTLEHLAVLGGIVLIRTFLSFSLEVELEGRWPWRGEKSGRSSTSS